ncbi:DUF6069 family protein [Micromonospora sp. R77]|uniref:DUF6069 family protein n=1 Tax=Micromonospora sp. R77 TaxID=2925836 RepID=UPI001F610896|nr:DUF6069 family protein [Micromonospora sp. R77]MCI4065588.1 DUF6069 family protein [Micromonospora sp. R77]
MSNTRQAPPAPPRQGGTAKRRLLAIAVATAVTVAVWFIARALDVTLAVNTGGNRQEITLGAVIAATVVAGLIGWALLALLERLTAAGRTIWTIVAVLVLLVSLLGPLGGVSTGAKATLAVMHLAAAAVIIPAFRRR